jgi:hypothetical protein
VTVKTSVEIAEMKNGVAEGILSVVQATQFATVAFFFALLVTLISMFLHATRRSAAQWVAILNLVFAVANKP